LAAVSKVRSAAVIASLAEAASEARGAFGGVPVNPFWTESGMTNGIGTETPASTATFHAPPDCRRQTDTNQPVFGAGLSGSRNSQGPIDSAMSPAAETATQPGPQFNVLRDGGWPVWAARAGLGSGANEMESSARLARNAA
jgi:hypothetical protein